MDHRLVIALLLVLASAITMLAALPDIHRWEREAGYPFGKMCDVFNNCSR